MYIQVLQNSRVISQMAAEGEQNTLVTYKVSLSNGTIGLKSTFLIILCEFKARFCKKRSMLHGHLKVYVVPCWT